MRMANSEQPLERVRGIDRRHVLFAAAVAGAAAVAAALYIRQRRQRARGNSGKLADADGATTSRSQPAADATATPPEQPGGASAQEQTEDGAAGAAVLGAGPGGVMSAEQHVWHAVSTLHAGGRVHKGSDPRWCWSEDEADVIVESAASGVHSAREISVKFEPRHLALSVCGERIIDGDLPNAVHADECSWQFEGSGKDRRVVLTLVKALAAVRWDMVVLS